MFLPVIIFSVSLILSPTAADSLRSTFASKKGFQVEFTQTVKGEIFPDQKDKDRATGTVKFVRPSHLIWNYQTPHPRLIEYSAGELTITEDSEKQKIRDSGQINLQDSFSFLWGQTNLKNFTIQNTGAKTFRVLPKKPSQAGFKWIDVTVAKGLVEKAIVENHLEGQSLLEFHHWKTIP